MLNTLKQMDHAVTYFFMELHTPWLNSFMIMITEKNNLFILMLLIIIISLFKYKVRALIFFLYLILLVGITDFTTAKIFKPWFGRLRPCHSLELDMLVGCGGKFGFWSNHAANIFAIFHFTILLFKKNSFFYLAYIMPVLVSISRIYLGKHYLTDVIVGGVYGILWAWIVSNFYKRAISKWRTRRDSNSRPSHS